MGISRFTLRCVITEWVYRMKCANGYLSNSIRPKKRASVWDWPLFVQSSKLTAASSRLKTQRAAEHDSISHCHLQDGHEMISPIPPPMVFVIDDDESVRKSIKRLLQSADHETEIFKSAADFLQRPHYPGPTCIIVDVQMPTLSGLEFQEALIQRRREEQLVFITGHGDIPMCAQVMKAGAIDFLPKPFKPRELLKCVERALARSTEQRRSAAEKNEVRRLLDTLTPREFEVLLLVITGMLNKQIGGELNMAEKTVKVHRGRVMQKLGVTSVAQLVRLVQKTGLVPGRKFA